MRKLFVLDTNVLMHDPTALFRFQEHDLYIPIVVLEELDACKKGVSEVARNARQASRYLAELMGGFSPEKIRQGLPLQHEGSAMSTNGKLYFQQDIFNFSSTLLDLEKPDNKIIATALAVQQQEVNVKVILVSKDINIRIKANIVGLESDDYFNDRVATDIAELHVGVKVLPPDFWEKHGKQLKSWQEHGETFYEIEGPEVSHWYLNDFLVLDDEVRFEGRVVRIQGTRAVIKLAEDFYKEKHAVWGITARNFEQNCSLNLLMDPSVDFITLQGGAGSGKTLLALAAGLSQTIDQKRYREIIVTRATVPVSEDIGFLPGTEEEKMTPWMGALMDNLEVLHGNANDDEWKRDVTNELVNNRIKIRSLNFMRGRTFLNKYIILDEAQNLTAKQMKTLITRAGPGTKIICIGDIAQIDTPYLTQTTSGLAYVIDYFKRWDYAGHITLVRGERSRLADYAIDMLQS